MFKHNDSLTIKSISLIYEREIHKLFYGKSKTCHLKNDASKKWMRNNQSTVESRPQSTITCFGVLKLSLTITEHSALNLPSFIQMNMRNKMFSISHTPSIKEIIPSSFLRRHGRELKWSVPACTSKSRTQDPPAKKNRAVLQANFLLLK